MKPASSIESGCFLCETAYLGAPCLPAGRAVLKNTPYYFSHSVAPFFNTEHTEEQRITEIFYGWLFFI